MNRSNTLLRLGSLAIAASLTTLAYAQDGTDGEKPATDRPKAEKPAGKGGDRARPQRRGGGDPLMAALDVDKNRELSAAELDGAPKALIALDKNKDGAITKEELRPARPEHGNMLARLDKNKDGKIAKDELPEPMQARFAELDKNSDGFLDEAELKAMRGAARKPRGDAKPEGEAEPKPDGERPEGRGGRGGRGGQPGQDGRRGRGGRRGAQRGGGSALARAIDMNKDGTIDAEEIRSSTTSLKALDKNQDGKLTRDELGGGRGAAGFMSRFDTDGDGKLSRDEAPGRMADRFDDIDTDDGLIDSAEMEEMMKTMRRGGGRGRGGAGGGRPDKKADE